MVSYMYIECFLTFEQRDAVKDGDQFTEQHHEEAVGRQVSGVCGALVVHDDLVGDRGVQRVRLADKVPHRHLQKTGKLIKSVIV